MQHPTLPGRASLFTAAGLTFIAALSLLASPTVRAALPPQVIEASRIDLAIPAPCLRAAPEKQKPRPLP